MPSGPASQLNSALTGRPCRVARREADWDFSFGDGHDITVAVPWRIVTSEGIAHGDEDDGQWFGLSQPLDGESRANELLRGDHVVGVELDEVTADLRISFASGARIDVFNNSAGYEGWQAYLGSDRLIVVAYGGGKLGP